MGLTQKLTELAKEPGSVKKEQDKIRKELHVFIDQQVASMGNSNNAIQSIIHALDEKPTQKQVTQIVSALEESVQNSLARRQGGVDESLMDEIFEKMRAEVSTKASRNEVLRLVAASLKVRRKGDGSREGQRNV